MDIIKIIKIRQLVIDIKEENDIDKISNMLDKLYQLIQPLIKNGYSVSDIISTALVSYNSVMCVPDVLL